MQMVVAERMDNINEQIENFSRDKNYIWQMEMLQIENMVTEINEVLKKLISTLDTVKSQWT